MSKLMIALFVTAGLGFRRRQRGADELAHDAPISKASYTQAVKDADAQYKIDKDACASLSGNAKDICVAEAKGKASVAKAEAEAAYKHNPKARESARIAHAQANYNVAIEKCDDLAGNRKDVCVKEAKSELVKGKANAKVDRVAADTNKEAATKQAEARKDAGADKREAEYKVAIEKCDALAVPQRMRASAARSPQYGKP